MKPRDELLQSRLRDTAQANRLGLPAIRVPVQVECLGVSGFYPILFRSNLANFLLVFFNRHGSILLHIRTG